MRTNVKRLIPSVIALIFFVGLITLGEVFRSGEQDGGAGIAPKALAKELGGAKSLAGKCSEATVNGVYAFALTGSVIGVGPISASGTTTFDGAGGVTIHGTLNTTTLSPALEGTFPGTYVVNPNDCTATATINCPRSRLLARPRVSPVRCRNPESSLAHRPSGRRSPVSGRDE